MSRYAQFDGILGDFQRLQINCTTADIDPALCVQVDSSNTASSADSAAVKQRV